MRRRLLRLWIHRLRKLWRLSWKGRWLLIRAVSWLGLARLAVLTLPLRWIAPYLGQPMQESPDTNRPEQRAAVEGVAWAVQTMSRYTPWDSNCLAQAIAAKRMLQLYDIPSTLYLGVAREDSEGLEAHAWLRSGALVVTGAQEMPRFTVLSTFAEGDDTAADPHLR